MFESAVSYLLNRFLGKYVQNLDSSKLNVSIFKGDVELKDLQLRPEALVELKLPVEVKAGHIGYIKADIPWTSLFSASVVVKVEDIYLLAGPIIDRKYDPQRERDIQNALKHDLLESLEASAITKISVTAENDPGFLQKLYTYVVNNIQISIGRVHLRYEDTVTNPDHPFACGVMLKHISAYTTDSKWQPAQMDNSATLVYKLLEMSELSVYWNPYIPEQHLIRSRINTDGWKILLKNSILNHCIFEEEFDFVFQPVSAEMKIIISKDNNTTLPKLFADISLPEIHIFLSRQQFLNMLLLNDSFKLMSVNQKYRKYHPNVPLKISPRSWWVYAYTAVVEERIRPFSWERFKKHRSRYRTYKDMYKKSLQTPNNETLKAMLSELESDLDICNIVMAREQAKAEYAPEKIVHKEKKKGWWASWFGSDSEEEVVDVEINRESKDWLARLSKEERAKLLKGIGYDENASKSRLPKEYVEYKVQVNLKSCCLSLVNYSKKILQISVTQMLGSFESRPAGDAYRVSCHTESFTVDGASVEHDLVPIITSDVNVYAPSVNQVFTLDFESHPLYVDADFSLKMNVQPVEIVYDEHSVCEVWAFVQVPSGTIDVKSVAMETIQGVAKFSQAGLIYAIQQHKTVHLAVNMKSPYIVIPEFGTLHRGGNVLITDLGMLQVKSELQPKNASLENLSASEISAKLYDQFTINVSDVKILLADSGDDWHTAQVQQTSEYHILPSMKLTIDFYNSVKPDYKQFPQQKVITNLPTFEISISDRKLLVLWNFFYNFPIPSSSSIVMSMSSSEDMVDGVMIKPVMLMLDAKDLQMEPDIATLKNIKQTVLGRKLVVKPSKQHKTISKFVSDTDLSADDVSEPWEKFEDLKPVDDISSSYNITKRVLRFVIREVVIQISKAMSNQEKPYLMFRADRMRLDIAVSEYGLAIHASLGAVQLVDKIHVGVAGEYMELLSTKPGRDLVSVLYRKVELECPDFVDMYNSMLQAMNVKVETLKILIDQGAMMYLKTFVEGILKSIEQLEMKTHVSTVVSSLITEATEPINTTNNSSIDQGQVPNNSVVLWNLVMDLEDLSLVLTDKNSRLAEMCVRDIKGRMVQRQDKVTLIGRLRDIDVKDCSQGALYPNVLMLRDKEDSLFKFSLTKYGRSRKNLVADNKQPLQPFDYTVNVHVGHLQCVALGKFYWDIMKFTEPLLSAELLDTASVALRTVTKQVEGFQQENNRYGITIDMLTPTILLPVCSESCDLLLLKSGNLHVHNVFDTTQVGQGVKQEWNHIFVSLTFAQLWRARLSLDDVIILQQDSLLQPMKFQTDIRLAFDPVMSDIQTDIDCKLEKVYGCLSQKDSQVLLGVLKRNWFEGAPSADSVPMRIVPLLHHQSQESGIITTTMAAVSHETGTVHTEMTMTSSTAAKKTSTVILFNMDGLQLELHQDTKDDETVDFTMLKMGKISGSVNIRSDNETKVTVALETLCVENTKPSSKHVEKKILYYDKANVNKDGSDTSRPLVSLIYKVSGDGNQKVDIMMEKVILNVQIPYIMELSTFITDSFTSENVTPSSPEGGSTHLPLPPYTNDTSDEGSVLTVYFSVKQPEVVLLADPENPTSRTIVLNADVVLEYVSSSMCQKIWSKITALSMFSSPYGASSEYNTKLISPCSVEFDRGYDLKKQELHMSVKIPKLFVHLTPSTLQLILDVVDILKQTSMQSSQSTGNVPIPVQDHMWNIKTVSPEKWLDIWNKEQSASHSIGPFDSQTETLKLNIEEVCAFFEVENMDQSVPLLCVRTLVAAELTNWTKHMRLLANLELDVCYYNEKLSVWEPLVEPNLVKEGEYMPWALTVQVFQAQSFPIVCNYDDNGLDMPYGVQSDLEQIISKNHIKSSSSENEADEEVDAPNQMTILRPKFSRRKMIVTNDKSYGPERDEDNVDGYIMPDTVDVVNADVVEDLCTYVILSSQDKLLVNITPPAINVIRDVLKSLDKESHEDVTRLKERPALAIHNKLGIAADVIVHRNVKVRNDYVYNCRVCFQGDYRHMASPTNDDFSVIREEEEEEETDGTSLSSVKRPLRFVSQTLADAGNTLVSAGAFVFDDDVMAGTLLDRDGVQLQVAGFDVTPTLFMNRACRKLVHIFPRQTDTDSVTKYYIVYDIDIDHSHKSITIESPLQIKNNLTLSVDVMVLQKELESHKHLAKNDFSTDFVKLTTLAPGEVFALPLFAAYHCAIYLHPTDLQYDTTSVAIWWPDLVQMKDRHKFVCCKSRTDHKILNMKVLCVDGEPLHPAQMLTRTLPYFILTLCPPVILHNYLPYDLQFSLQGRECPSIIKHGDSTPLYTVDQNQPYTLNFLVADYLGCDWKGNLDITKGIEEFKAIVMDTDLDPDNNFKHLSLSVYCCTTETLNLYIYSPYWIVNKTDVTFNIRGSMSDVTLECLPARCPLLFRYKKNKRKKAKLKVYDSQWSHGFSLDTVGNYGVVECHDAQRRQTYTFMVQCQMSKLKLTKIVTVLPFYLVINNSTKALRFMEENKTTDLWFDIYVKQCVPFWPVTESHNMYVKYEKSNLMSQHFPFKKHHNTVLRMDYGTALCVIVSGGTQTPITVEFQDYDVGDAPVKVDNLCDVFIKIHQKDQSQTVILASNQTVLYTWDDPTAETTLMWNVYGQSSQSYPAAITKDGYGYVNVKLMSLKSSRIGDNIDGPDIPQDSSPEDESDETDSLFGKMDASLVGKTRCDKLVIYWVSYLDNQQRVFMLTQDERVAKVARMMNDAEQARLVVFVSLDGLCVSIINQAYEEVALLSLASHPAIWEVEVNSRWKMLNVELQTWLEDQWHNKQEHASLQQQIEADLGKMQMLKPYMGALRRSYNPGLWLNYRASKHHMSLHAKVQKVQLDNQLSDAYFAIVLHSCATPVYILRKKGHKPFIDLGMMRRTVPENNVDTFRYFKILLQEFSIQVDKGFLMSLYDVFAHLFTDSQSESYQLQSDLTTCQKSLHELASVMSKGNANRMFFEYLRLSPLKMHVSLSLNGISHVFHERSSTIVEFFLGSVGTTFTEMQDVEIRMPFFEIKGRSRSWQQLLEQVQSHYFHEAIHQAYVLILGLDVLGNPYGLIKDFTQGFGDLFYEPFLDSVQGSDEFAESLVRGVHSMLGNTVGGAAGSIARITGSIGSALAALSLDRDYRIKRRAEMQQKPSNLPVSLVLAGRGFVMGVCLGLTGVIMDPVRGAREEGVEGFFKGVGKGIMGLLTKPTGGVLDMVSMAFDGLQRAAELENNIVYRMRQPRFINTFLGLRPYSVYQAIGASLLLNLNKGQFAKSDLYWAHAQLSPGDRADIILITTRHILLLQKHRCWGGWDIEWEVKVDDILGIPAIVENKLIFKVRQDESSMNVFAGGMQEIMCDDSDMLLWIQQRIENLVKYKQK